MIFTHIFRYLDDRDAAEELQSRRTSGDNSSSPAINSRFQEASSHWENRDARFKQVSWKSASTNAPGGSVLHAPRKDCMAEGFSSLRADVRPSAPNLRVLPPICRSHITGGDKQLMVNEQNSAKLPPIEPFASKVQPGVKEKRSRSKMRNHKETAILKGDSCAPQNSRGDQKRLSPYPAQVKELEESNNFDTGKVMGAITVKDKLTDSVLIEGKGSPAQASQKTGAHETPSVHNATFAKGGTKKNCHKGFQKTAKQLNVETRSEVESTQNDAINANERCIQSRQTRTKDMREQKQAKIEDQSCCNNLGVSEPNKTQVSCFSTKRNKENGKLSYGARSVNKAEYLHMTSSQTVLQVHGGASLVTRETNLEFVPCDFERGRRNAICEVLEKTTEPNFGSSLYEMRQNLIQLL